MKNQLTIANDLTLLWVNTGLVISPVRISVQAVLGRVPPLTLRHTTDLLLAPVAAREMSASGHYTRGRSLRINNKAVSVSSPCYRRSSSPTLFICFRRARLLTSAAARLRSTDLLSAFSTASATLWPAAAPPTRPAAGRLAADAAHRAAGVDCDVLAGGSIAEDGNCVLFQVRRCNSIGVIGTAAIECSILYGDKTYCFYTAIEDFETFDNSRLTAKFCVGGMRRSVQALRCRALTTGRTICAVRRNKSGQLRSFRRQQGRQNHLAGLYKLLDVGTAASEEQGQME